MSYYTYMYETYIAFISTDNNRNVRKLCYVYLGRYNRVAIWKIICLTFSTYTCRHTCRFCNYMPVHNVLLLVREILIKSPSSRLVSHSKIEYKETKGFDQVCLHRNTHIASFPWTKEERNNPIISVFRSFHICPFRIYVPLKLSPLTQN